MSETVRPEETKKKSNNVLFALLGVLSIALLVTAYLFYQRENELQTEISQKNVELEETYNKLESISNELDMKIQEISKLGGDIEELKLAKEQVEKEKEHLRRAKIFTFSALSVAAMASFSAICCLVCLADFRESVRRLVSVFSPVFSLNSSSVMALSLVISSSFIFSSSS